MRSWGDPLHDIAFLFHSEFLLKFLFRERITVSFNRGTNLGRDTQFDNAVIVNNCIFSLGELLFAEVCLDTHWVFAILIANADAAGIGEKLNW
jgi:hypothetical protein